MCITVRLNKKEVVTALVVLCGGASCTRRVYLQPARLDGLPVMSFTLSPPRCVLACTAGATMLRPGATMLEILRALPIVTAEEAVNVLLTSRRRSLAGTDRRHTAINGNATINSAHPLSGRRCWGTCVIWICLSTLFLRSVCVTGIGQRVERIRRRTWGNEVCHGRRPRTAPRGRVVHSLNNICMCT